MRALNAGVALRASWLKRWLKSPPKGTDAILAGLLAIVFVLYGWLASVALEPTRLFDKRVVSMARLERDGAREPWDDGRAGSPILAALARATAAEVARFASGALGGFGHGVELAVSLDRPLLWSVSGERVEIGATVLAADGQLAKALLKAWALQNAGRAIAASNARVEVVSDALLAIMRGGLSLQDPRTRAVAKYSRSLTAPSWLGELASFRHACESGWAPLETASLCQAPGAGLPERPGARASAWQDELSELGARALLGGLVWRAYRPLSPFSRLEFTRRWAQWLRQPFGQRDGPRPESLLAWRAWLADELEFILPPFVQPDGNGPAGLALLERQAQLRDAGPPAVDYVARVDGSEPLAELSALPSWRAVLRGPAAAGTGARLEASGGRLLPGSARISASEARELVAGDLIWESCQPPTLAQAAEAARAKRILFAQNCASAKIDYRPYFRYGGESFARANPGLPFIQMHRPSLAYLLAKGLRGPGESVLSLVGEREGVMARGPRPPLGGKAWLSPQDAADRLAGRPAGGPVEPPAGPLKGQFSGPLASSLPSDSRDREPFFGP